MDDFSQVPAVHISRLHHVYPGTRHEAPRLALDGVNLNIPTGAFFVLTGPNGSGKSTLFKILSGLTRPGLGTVSIHGQDLLAVPNRVRRQMGVIFQRPALDKHLTVLENFQIHAGLHAIPSHQFQPRLDAALAWSDLQTRLHTRVGTLSGGLARQAELVKVLLHEPQLLLLDEPTAGLDPGGRMAFMSTLRRLQKKRNVTILMTSHIFAEAEQADLVGILRQGQLLAMDAPSRLTARLGNEILVIQADDPAAIAHTLTNRPELSWQIHNHELRIQGTQLPTLMADLLQAQRARIQTLAIKQPTLEDLYITLTGRALTSDEEEENR
ncbi:MAG: ABC transporter ATP-binding protein [Magnetococcales bacterium]|nr:ABC transporter ATP-binding protein [Magnetococcales bacterium]